MNTVTFLLQSTLFITLVVIGANCSTTTGPYNIVFTSAGNCPAAFNDEDLITLETRSKRLSRARLVLNINASLRVPMDDNLDIEVNMAKQTNQGWKDNFFILDLKKACSALKLYLPSVERDMARQLKLKSCPIPVGNYSLNLQMNMDFKMVIPAFAYGKYRSRVYLLQGHNRIFCVEAVFDAVPKKNG